MVQADLPSVHAAMDLAPSADGLRERAAIASHLCGAYTFSKRYADPRSTTPLGLLSRVTHASSEQLPALQAGLDSRIVALGQEDPKLASVLTRCMAQRHLQAGDVEQGMREALRAKALAESANDRSCQAWAQLPLAGAHMRAAANEASIEAAREGLRMLDALPPHPRLLASLLDVRGRAESLHGDLQAAHDTLNAAREVALASGVAIRIASIELNLASVEERLVGLEAAQGTLRSALGRFERLGHLVGRGVTHNNLANNAALRGDFARAAVHLDAAESVGAGPYVDQLLITTRATWMLLSGQFESVVAHTERHIKGVKPGETLITLLLLRMLAEKQLGRASHVATAVRLEALSRSPARPEVSNACALGLAYVRGAPLPVFAEPAPLLSALRLFMA